MQKNHNLTIMEHKFTLLRHYKDWLILAEYAGGFFIYKNDSCFTLWAVINPSSDKHHGSLSRDKLEVCVFGGEGILVHVGDAAQI